MSEKGWKLRGREMWGAGGGGGRGGGSATAGGEN